MEEFILEKPRINDDMRTLRIPFKFKRHTVVTLGIGVSEADVEALSVNLQDDFKVSINSKLESQTVMAQRPSWKMFEVSKSH